MGNTTFSGPVISTNGFTSNGRLDFSSADVTASNTDGGLLKAGTSSSRVVEDTANMKFLSFYLDNGATSGDNRGMYLRLYLTGAGGGGEAARIFTTCEDVAASTAHGAHISLNFGTSGSVTGQGIAMRATLHIPSTAWTGNQTYAAIQAEVYSDAATSDPGGSAKLSAIRVVNDGNATGMADVDDDCDLLQLNGWTSGTGNLYYGHTLRIDIADTNYYLLLSEDENRLDLSSINVDAANTDGGVIKMGTSGSPVTEDTANMKFISMYFDNGATSGDNRGMYLRLYLTGAGGGGEAARIFTTCSDVAAGTAHGAHISLNFGSTGSVTGLGCAVRGTLHVPDDASWAPGTITALQAEIYSDGAASDTDGATEVSFIRCINDGNASGIADVDDDAFLLSIQGGSVGAGNMVAAQSAAAVSHTIRIKVGGTTYYLMVSDTQ